MTANGPRMPSLARADEAAERVAESSERRGPVVG